MIILNHCAICLMKGVLFTSFHEKNICLNCGLYDMCQKQKQKQIQPTFVIHLPVFVNRWDRIVEESSLLAPRAQCWISVSMSHRGNGACQSGKASKMGIFCDNKQEQNQIKPRSQHAIAYEAMEVIGQ